MVVYVEHMRQSIKIVSINNYQARGLYGTNTKRQMYFYISAISHNIY